ncbi:cytochrome C oxidase subunit II [Rhizobium sp. HT1-10]|uniref:cytochrome C oxidase subunit II n=1 Tax=Rhizobium sp. HT1-10 TaxID=3111638 RepID=UPI003C1E87E7
MSTETHSASAKVAERIERRWAVISILIVVFLTGMAAYAGVHQATMPQAQVETIDPVTLHMSGEFVETNLGSAVEPDGSVTVRVVGQQYSFTPSCILVPTDTKVTIRGTSADVVHGLLIEQTNVNAMLVPGYVSQLSTRFDRAGDHLMPCQEFCSVGHEGMWAKVKVIDKQQFMAMAASRRRMSCVK